jgi:hypothetical protein
MEFGLYTSNMLQNDGEGLGGEVERRGVRLRTLVGGVEIIGLDKFQRGGVEFLDAGLQVGDVIISVDGRSCVGKGCSTVILYITGSEDDKGPAALIDVFRKIPTFPTATKVPLTATISRDSLLKENREFCHTATNPPEGSLTASWQRNADLNQDRSLQFPPSRAKQLTTSSSSRGKDELLTGILAEPQGTPLASAWVTANQSFSHQRKMNELLVEHIHDAVGLLQEPDPNKWIDENLRSAGDGEASFQAAAQLFRAVNTHREMVRMMRQDMDSMRGELGQLHQV